MRLRALSSDRRSAPAPCSLLPLPTRLPLRPSQLGMMGRLAEPVRGSPRASAWDSS
jgi:hypothetical protein